MRSALMSVLPRALSHPPARFARDVIVSCVATGLVTAAVAHWSAERAATAPLAVGKTEARLPFADVSFVQEDVPVRRTGTFDTIAMFGLPQAEPTAWSTEPPPPASPEVVRAAAVERSHVPSRPITTAAVATGAVASGDARPAAAPLPPTRPAVVRSAEAALVVLPAASAHGPTVPVRDGIRVFGWSVPGTDVLLSGRDALRVASAAGTRIATAGEQAVDLLGTGASEAGRAAGRVGGAIARTVGLD